GVRGPDEGEAAQGVATESTPVGAGGSREDVGQRCPSRGGIGAGIKEGNKTSEEVGRRGSEGKGGNEREQPGKQVRGCGRRECAPRKTREEDHLGALNTLAGGGSLQPERTRSGCTRKFWYGSDTAN